MKAGDWLIAAPSAYKEVIQEMEPGFSQQSMAEEWEKTT